MTSRDKILQAITTNKPAFVELPLVDITQVIQYDDLKTQFITILESIGGSVIEISDITILQQIINQEVDSNHFIVNTIPALGEVNENLTSLSALELAGVEKAFIQGTIGVAENGAVWLYEHQIINRLLPFICQHLVLILNKENIVPTLHQAYQQIYLLQGGYGVLIAGPSKTADIEQSLVIGAHGARSLTVYLV